MNLCRIFLIICASMVFAIGLLMIFNTSSAEVLDDFASQSRGTHHALIRQMIYAVVGCIVAVGVWYVGYENFLRLSFPFLCILSFLLIMAFVPGIGQMRNGAYRWVGIGGYTVQPSEFVKLLIPAYYIYAVKSHGWVDVDFKYFLKIGAVIIVPLALVMLEPDNGTTAIIIVTLVMLFFVTGVKMKYWVAPLFVVILVVVVAAYNMPYVVERIKVYLNPELDVRGWGHQPYQAKIAAGSGGLVGRGPGNSLQKLNYLPEAQNDYIAAIYAEEFGFIGIFILITCYTVITYLGFYIAAYAKDKEGFYLAIAVTFLIAIQAFLNLGVVSGFLPSTGLNLPLFSQGGTSLMTNIVGISMLLNISWKSEKFGGVKHGA